jgi:alpha-N-acetylglucosamine transferase
LEKEFDMVARLDTAELKLQNDIFGPDLIKLWCWNLRAWEKCVFLDSNSIVRDTFEIQIMLMVNGDVT